MQFRFNSFGELAPLEQSTTPKTCSVVQSDAVMKRRNENANKAPTTFFVTAMTG
jgi:hypothetical protein